MSNRLLEIGRIPLIPDPVVAMKAGAIFSEALARSNRLGGYTKDFFAPSIAIWNALRRLGQLIDRAVYIRDLSVMGDRELALHGVERARIPELFFKEGVGDFLYRPNSVRAGDGER